MGNIHVITNYHITLIMEREFKSEVLGHVYGHAKSLGYRVYTFESRGLINQIFIENEKGFIGTCQGYFGGIRYSTVHKSERGSGLGTGFGDLTGKDFDDVEDIDKCFMVAPGWAMQHAGDIYKYKSFEEYKEKNTILKYYEI